MENFKKSNQYLFTKLNNFLDKRSLIFLLLSFIISTIVYFKVFDIRVSLAGDDSTYIMFGYNFLHYGNFPTFHGPLYPIIVAGIMWVFGFSIPVLKIFSSVFLLFSTFLFFKTFNKRISSYLLIGVMLLFAINAFMAEYSTLTFNEPFYIFMQALLFFVFLRFIDLKKVTVWDYLLVSLITYLLYLTKHVGIAGLFAIIFFLILYRRWKDVGLLTVFFSGIYLLFSGIKRLFFNVSGVQFSEQFKGVTRKDPYDMAAGQEDLAGFIQRLIDNAHLYISKHFYIFLGLKEVDNTNITPILTIITVVLIGIGMFFAFRWNKYIFFTGLYVLIFSGINFLALQKFWDQARLILPVFHYALLVIFYIFFIIFDRIQILKKWKFVLGFLMLFLFVTSFRVTLKAMQDNKEVLKESIKGNMLYGLNPDRVNYANMSKYAAKIAGENENIACRKPSISFIYGKRSFYGIFRVEIEKIEDIFKAGKRYYMLPAQSKNLNQLSRKNIVAICVGSVKQKNEKIKNNRLYIIFEYEPTHDLKAIEDRQVTKQELQTIYSKIHLFSPDKLLNNLIKSNVKYIIIANLRINPQKKTGHIVNTIHRYVSYIRVKYPNFIQYVHQVGDDEKAFLYRLNY